MIRIGVLGGIGPEATGEFYIKLIERMQTRGLIRSNVDYPQIIINSIPAPELPAGLCDEAISFEDLDPLYVSGLKELDKWGVDFIVIVCNTVHLFYDELQKAVKAPIINLREEMKKTLAKKNISTIAVLGTPWTVKMGLYRFEDIKEISLNDDEIEQLYKCIVNFSRGYEKQKQIQIVKELYDKCIKRGAEAIILGCTEVALMLAGLPSTIDSIEVLVEATIERFCRLKHLKSDSETYSQLTAPKSRETI